ncbi:DegV family protein [Vagococcus sp. JNUCC 83]
MTEKIALLVDSGMDIPTEAAQLEGVFIVPLSINYSDGSYLDNIEISAAEIYSRLDEEIPTTSLPSLDIIEKTINQIKNEGYTHILTVTISSGLSGTHNALRLLLNDHQDIKSHIIDTKSIGIGGGIQAAYLKDLIDKHYSFDSLVEIGELLPKKGRVFFSLPTLEYLKKGGRIGLVTSIIGTALNLNPVISCNNEGIYYTVTKARGRKKSLQKMIDQLVDFAGDSTDYRIGIAYGTCIDEAENVKKIIEEKLPHADVVYFDDVSPVLGVHTGPDVIGVTILDLN